MRNDDFYEMPEGANKTIDLLFLMANAPVSTLSLPESGSEAYIGLARVMEIATKELSEKFPAFFGEEETAKQCAGYVWSQGVRECLVTNGLLVSHVLLTYIFIRCMH